MAVIGTEQEDPNAPASGGSSAFAGGGTGQGATTSVASPAPTSSGSFTNLQSYLDANQGAGQTMGGAVQNQVNQAGQAADSAINSFGAAGAADARGGTANLDQGVMNQITGGYNAGTGVYSGPQSVTANYTGQTDPSKITGYGSAQTAYGNLQGVLGTPGTPGAGVNGGQAGVSGILKNIYNQPGYTAGENQLDTVLTTGDKGWQGVLNSLNGQWGGEGQNWTNAQSNVANLEQAGQKTSTATDAAYKAAIQAQKDKAAAWRPSVDSGTVAPAATGLSAPLQKYGGPAIKKLTPAPAVPQNNGSPYVGGGSKGSAPIITPTAVEHGVATAAGDAYNGVSNTLEKADPSKWKAPSVANGGWSM